MLLCPFLILLLPLYIRSLQTQCTCKDTSNCPCNILYNINYQDGKQDEASTNDLIEEVRNQSKTNYAESITSEAEAQSNNDKIEQDSEESNNIAVYGSKRKPLDFGTQLKKSNLDLGTQHIKNPDLTQTYKKNPELTQTYKKNPELTQSNKKNPELTQSGKKNPELTQSGKKNPELTQSGKKNPELTQSNKKKLDQDTQHVKNPDLTQSDKKNPELSQTSKKNPELTQSDKKKLDQDTQHVKNPDLTQSNKRNPDEWTQHVKNSDLTQTQNGMHSAFILAQLSSHNMLRQ
jgi:hypothetical protein